MTTTTPKIGQNVAYLICFAVISVAVTGFFVGLQSPMNPTATGKTASSFSVNTAEIDATDESILAVQKADENHKMAAGVIPATHYADMHKATIQRTAAWRTSIAELKLNVDPMAEVKIPPQQKSFALAVRNSNRAFNGSPPTVSHPIDQMSSRACMACHETGADTQSLHISKMPHQFLANCTQCHVENNPQHMPGTLFRESEFIGLPAPTGGPRAYEGAPPMIPHSTWMRVDCMSCHGPAGFQGMKTTHPWRTNCQQCHAPSSTLDQVQLHSLPKFLPPQKIER